MKDSSRGRAGDGRSGSSHGTGSCNMLKLTRLLHFHAPDRIELLDYYERTLFNQMLGEQDPDSAHGFNIYYTGLVPGAYEQQPDFMGGDPEAYSTDYANFSCDHGSGMETQAKFADTVWTHGADTLHVNLFLPSEATWEEKGITWRQTTRFPDAPRTTLTVTAGGASHTLRIRIPAWAEGARVTVNGGQEQSPGPGSWAAGRRWNGSGKRATPWRSPSRCGWSWSPRPTTRRSRRCSTGRWSSPGRRIDRGEKFRIRSSALPTGRTDRRVPLRNDHGRPAT